MSVDASVVITVALRSAIRQIWPGGFTPRTTLALTVVVVPLTTTLEIGSAPIAPLNLASAGSAESRCRMPKVLPRQPTATQHKLLSSSNVSFLGTFVIEARDFELVTCSLRPISDATSKIWLRFRATISGLTVRVRLIYLACSKVDRAHIVPC